MTTNFNFGLPGPLTNLNFTASDISDGNIQYDFNFGGAAPESPETLYHLLNGLSNHHLAIWCDPTASLTNGRFYVATNDSLTIIKNNDGEAVLEDFYTQDVSGRAEETLDAAGIVDINVVS